MNRKCATCGATVPLHAAHAAPGWSPCTLCLKVGRLRARQELILIHLVLQCLSLGPTPGNTHPQPDHATIETRGLSGSGGRHSLRATPPPCGVGTPIPVQSGLWRDECRLFSTTWFFSDSSKIAQQTLIFGKGALVSVNAEVLRPREEMGALEPETRANRTRAPRSSELLAADLVLRAAQGPGVPPRQHDLGFWSE